MKLYYYYDKEADVFYLSKGKPSAKDRSEEIEDDIALRIDSKSKKVSGFTIFNFTRRTKRHRMPLALPIEVELTPA